MKTTNKTDNNLKIISDQGNRLKQFRIESGFTKKSTFARYISTTNTTISAIENYGREISDSVMDLILFKFPYVNPEWLRRGTLPKKLLTIKTVISDHEGAEEANEKYEKVCHACMEKDKKIESLRTELEMLLKEYNECLKKLSAVKVG